MFSAKWVRVEDATDHALHLLGQAKAEAESAGRVRELREIESLEDLVRANQARGGVLMDRTGRPQCLALWDAIEGVGRRVRFLYGRPDSRNLEGWTEILSTLLEPSEPDGPAVLVHWAVAGISTAQADGLLARWGFLPYHREQLVLPPDRPLPPPDPRPLVSGRIRPVNRRDFDQVVRLNAASYRDELERYLYATTRDPTEDSRRLLQRLRDGDFGKPLDDASVVLEIDGALRGASLVTQRPEYLLIADVEVHPEARGRGYARRLLLATLTALSALPRAPIALAVIRENAAAYHLYSDLGFDPTDMVETVWANPVRLGIEPPAGPH